MTTNANLAPDAFAGTARAYLRYRPPYPRALLDDIVSRAAAPSGSVLLDLASGPGRIALDLAGSFQSVTAIDLEPEMIEVGAEEAGRRGIGNITWLVGRAEDLDLSPESIDLITIGEAFHRLDQGVISRKALNWLKPGGHLATVGTDGILAGRELWQKAVADIANAWMRRAFPTGWAQGRPGAELDAGGFERVLRRAGFVDVESRRFAEPRDWNFEAVLGYLRSMSVCSEKALGADFPAFEADLRAALLGVGGLSEDLGAGYTMGRKPP